MRGHRALLIALFILVVVVVLLLFALFKRHDKLITVVSSQGLVGGYALAGDTLIFTTLYPHDPGYVVHFLSKPYPCGKDPKGHDIQTITVTADKPGSCKVTPPEGQQNSNIPFFYEIELDASSFAGQVAAQTSESTEQFGQNEHPYNAIPCRLCAVMGLGNTDESDSDTLKNLGTGSNHVTKLITCGDDDTAVVGDAVVVLGNAAALSWLGSPSWSTSGFTPVPASTNLACSNGSTFSSSGNQTQCQVATAGVYTYSVHLDTCAKDGTGNLTINPSTLTSQAQTHK
jgi:hypothetical protein